MTAFEKYLGRPMRDDEKAMEIEWYVSRVLTKEKMELRRKFLGLDTPKPKQLKLF